MLLSALAIALSGFLVPHQRTDAAAPYDTLPSCKRNIEPSDLADSTKWVSGEPYYAGTILRDILVLVFQEGTPEAERQSAIGRVNGTVVGTSVVARNEGVYLVRVPTDGKLEPLFRAIATLRSLRSVSIAVPEALFFFTPDPQSRTDSVGTGSSSPAPQEGRRIPAAEDARQA